MKHIFKHIIKLNQLVLHKNYSVAMLTNLVLNLRYQYKKCQMTYIFRMSLLLSCLVPFSVSIEKTWNSCTSNVPNTCMRTATMKQDKECKQGKNYSGHEINVN